MSTPAYVPRGALFQKTTSPDNFIAEGQRFDECGEGEEFVLTEVTIGPSTRYRVVKGKAVALEVVVTA